MVININDIPNHALIVLKSHNPKLIKIINRKIGKRILI